MVEEFKTGRSWQRAFGVSMSNRTQHIPLTKITDWSIRPADLVDLITSPEVLVSLNMSQINHVLFMLNAEHQERTEGNKHG